jgi:transcriptional regulator with XRE-family HTH domain
MIAGKIVAEAQRLLLEGRHSQRAVARLLGISRGTVRAIANGRRPVYPDSDDEAEQSAGPPVRCPSCGGTVFMPCRLCRTRETISEKHIRRPVGRTLVRQHSTTPDIRQQPSAALDLKPDHHARYLQVRQWRKEHSGQPLEGAAAQ